MKLKINVDKTIFNTIIVFLVIKLSFSFLNVELGWWQRMLTPNFEKFNFLDLPEDFSKRIEFIIIPLLILYLFRNRKWLKNKSILIIIWIVMVLINIVTSFFTNTPLMSSLDYSIKLMSPILLFISVIIHYQKYSFDIKKLMVTILIYCSVLVVVGILIFDKSYNHDKLWLPIYFASVHTHSYILVIIAIGFSYLLIEKMKYQYFIIFSCCFFLFLFFGHRIRTPMIFYLVYIFITTYLIHNYFKFMWINLFLFVPIVGMIYIVFSDFDINQFSAGRLVMYQAKYEMLKDYSIIELLFGKGKGSDFIRTETWWYAEKNSHNDILTFLIENGILYVLMFFTLIFSLITLRKKINIIYLSIIIGYLITSFLSNGLALRPVASYLLFIVLAYVFVMNDGNNKKVLV